MKRLLGRGALAALLALSAFGHAAEEQPVTTDQSRTERPASESAERDRSSMRLEELERCKEKAHGMKGPERARFMTECLASDRFEK